MTELETCGFAGRGMAFLARPTRSHSFSSLRPARPSAIASLGYRKATTEHLPVLPKDSKPEVSMPPEDERQYEGAGATGVVARRHQLSDHDRPTSSSVHGI